MADTEIIQTKEPVNLSILQSAVEHSVKRAYWEEWCVADRHHIEDALAEVYKLIGYDDPLGQVGRFIDTCPRPSEEECLQRIRANYYASRSAA